MDSVVDDIVADRIRTFPFWISAKAVPPLVERCKGFPESEGAQRFIAAWEALESGNLIEFSNHYPITNTAISHIVYEGRVDLFTNLLDMHVDVIPGDTLRILLQGFSDVWRPILPRVLEVLPSDLSHVLLALIVLDGPQKHAAALPWLFSRPQLLASAIVAHDLPLNGSRIRMLIENGLDLGDPAVLRWALLESHNLGESRKPSEIIKELVKASRDPFQVGPEGFSAYEISCALLTNWYYFPDHDRETLEAICLRYPYVHRELVRGGRLYQSPDLRDLRRIAPAVFEFLPFAWEWKSAYRIPQILGGGDDAPASWKMVPNEEFEVDLPIVRLFPQKTSCTHQNVF